MNIEDIRKLFFELVRIDSPSLREGAMAQRCQEELEALGFVVETDDAGHELGGETGNLIATLAGDESRTPVLLTAHLDTVAPGEGIRPRVDEAGVIRSDGRTILGADDKAGVTGILAGLREVVERGIQHGPIQVVFTIAEELGLQGSRHIDRQKVRARMGLCLDAGGPLGTLVVAGPSQVKWEATFIGRAAHAGLAPERGVSAIKVAAQAVASMPHGRIDPETTVNIGSFVGEGPTNIVRDRVQLKGEARSLDDSKLGQVVEDMERTFRQVAQAHGASMDFSYVRTYSGFRFGEDHPVRRLAAAALTAAGFSVRPVASGGGSDANHFTSFGIPTINIGVGYEDIHSPSEHIRLADLVGAARIVTEFVALA
jgi:tripeptide aminopeptidase